MRPHRSSIPVMRPSWLLAIAAVRGRAGTSSDGVSRVLACWSHSCSVNAPTMTPYRSVRSTKLSVSGRSGAVRVRTAPMAIPVRSSRCQSATTIFASSGTTSSSSVVRPSAGGGMTRSAARPTASGIGIRKPSGPIAENIASGWLRTSESKLPWRTFASCCVSVTLRAIGAPASQLRQSVRATLRAVTLASRTRTGGVPRRSCRRPAPRQDSSHESG
jgi:hypothetical protein